MSLYSFRRSNFGTVLILLGMLIITLGLFLGTDQNLSWAAPEQNPRLQTVPPRDDPDGDADNPDGSQNPSPEPPSQSPPESSPGSPGQPPDETNYNDDEDDQESSAPPPKGEDNTPTDSGNEESPESEAPPSNQSPDTKEEGSTGSAVPDAEEKTGSVGSGDGDGQLADLSLSKAVNNIQPAIGEVITFTLVVTNSGPNDVGQVLVQDRLPDKLYLTSVTPTQGRYINSQHLWDIGRLISSESVTLSLAVRVLEAGLITSTAEITAVDVVDPDSTPANEAEFEDDWARVVLDVALSSPQGQNGAIIAPANSGQPLEIDQQQLGTFASNLPPDASLAVTGPLIWLYALALGLILIIGGVFLANRT